MKHYLFTAATGVKTCNQVVSIRAALMTVRYIEIKLSLNADVHGHYPDFKMEIKHDGTDILRIGTSYEYGDPYYPCGICHWEPENLPINKANQIEFNQLKN